MVQAAISQPLEPFVDNWFRLGFVYTDSAHGNTTALPTGGAAAAVVCYIALPIPWRMLVSGIRIYTTQDPAGAGTARIKAQWYHENTTTPRTIGAKYTDPNAAKEWTIVSGGAVQAVLATDTTIQSSTTTPGKVLVLPFDGNVVVPAGLNYLALEYEGTFSAGTMRANKSAYGPADWALTGQTYATFAFADNPAGQAVLTANFTGSGTAPLISLTCVRG